MVHDGGDELVALVEFVRFAFLKQEAIGKEIDSIEMKQKEKVRFRMSLIGFEFDFSKFH